MKSPRLLTLPVAGFLFLTLAACHHETDPKLAAIQSKEAEVRAATSALEAETRLKEAEVVKLNALRAKEAADAKLRIARADSERFQMTIATENTSNPSLVENCTDGAKKLGGAAVLGTALFCVADIFMTAGALCATTIAKVTTVAVVSTAATGCAIGIVNGSGNVAAAKAKPAYPLPSPADQVARANSQPLVR